MCVFFQPTAWDKDPCPDDLPPPSDRYKDMYQQYTDDMKQSYRAKNHSLTEVCNQSPKCLLLYDQECYIVRGFQYIQLINQEYSQDDFLNDTNDQYFIFTVLQCCKTDICIK